jgi:hypothetical protein
MELVQRLEPPLGKVLAKGFDSPSLGVPEPEVGLNATIGKQDKLARTLQNR